MVGYEIWTKLSLPPTSTSEDEDEDENGETVAPVGSMLKKVPGLFLMSVDCECEGVC
jgi:hypothetical protein